MNAEEEYSTVVIDGEVLGKYPVCGVCDSGEYGGRYFPH